MQNPINKLKLLPSTEELKLFIDKYFNKTDCIPAIVLVGCDESISKFEKQGVCFWDISDVKDGLVEVLDDKYFRFRDIFFFVKDVCKIEEG